MFMKLDFPRIFIEFHLRKRRGGTLLKCLPNSNFIGGGIEATHLRPPGLDLFFGLFVPMGGGSFRGEFIKNWIFQFSIGELFTEGSASSTRFQKLCFLS